MSPIRMRFSLAAPGSIVKRMSYRPYVRTFTATNDAVAAAGTRAHGQARQQRDRFPFRVRSTPARGGRVTTKGKDTTLTGARRARVGSPPSPLDELSHGLDRVALLSGFDLGFRGLAVGPGLRLDRLAGLQVLVHLEEVLDLQPVELGHVVDVPQVRHPRVGGRHAQD